MSVESPQPATQTDADRPQQTAADAPLHPRQRRRRARPGLSLLARGEPGVWLTGGGLVICLIMIFGLLSIIFAAGTKTFWPRGVVRVELRDGSVIMGEIIKDEEYQVAIDVTSNMPREIEAHVNELLQEEVVLTLGDVGGNKPVEVVEVLIAQDQIIAMDTPIARVKVDGSTQEVTANHAGQLIEVTIQPGDSLQGADAALARVRTSLEVKLADFGEDLELSRVTKIHVGRDDQISTGDHLLTLTVDDQEFEAKSPYTGRVVGVYVEEGDDIETADTPMLKLKTEGANSITARRRQFRTGNFRISETHYDWVSNFAIVPGSEEIPPWAVVIERMEWGRFYGEPKEFALRHQRKVSGEEERLRKIIQFCQANQFRLESEQVEALLAALTSIQKRYEQVRQQNVAKFLAKFSATKDKRLDAFVDGAQQPVPADQIQSVQNVVELQEVWVGAASAWAQFEEHHGAARERHKRHHHMKEHDIGRVSRGEEESRIALRQEELDHREFDAETGKRTQTLFVLDTAAAIWDKMQEIEALGKSKQETAETLALIEKEAGTDSDLLKIARILQESFDAQVAQLLGPPTARLKVLEQQVDSAPTSAQEAVDRYVQAHRQALEERAEIEGEMQELEDENDRYEMRMVTSSTELLFKLNSTDTAPLERETLSDEMREDFELNGYTLGGDVAVKQINERRWHVIDESDPLRPWKVTVLNKQGQLQVLRDVEVSLSLGEIVRAYLPNQVTLGEKASLYLSRWGEFLGDDPREANSEGGVFPAIWGTIAMTIIMSVIVVPFGVLAALYLREYAKGGLIVSAVRISINNLAGVPSIVFGVFGLGFFCYLVGSYVDGGPENAGISPWPPALWFVWVGGLAAVAVGAFFCGILSLAQRRSDKSLSKKILGSASLLLWIVTTVLFVLVIVKTPYFTGFFEAEISKNPKFGKEGLLWASFTLALLTLPVVIVATEEALSAVPNSLREGSYASGASKWQTIRRIVLPHAMPGIMTGMILAMARGAGEVAPLMLVGVKKQTSGLPIDGVFPFIHLDRSFMHLGFHIYDVGFQSQNSEASKPMVFTTTLLLISIIAFLNLAAIALRSRLKRRFKGAEF